MSLLDDVKKKNKKEENQITGSLLNDVKSLGTDNKFQFDIAPTIETTPKVTSEQIKTMYDAQTSKTNEAKKNYQEAFSNALTNSNANQFKTKEETKTINFLNDNANKEDTSKLNPFIKSDLLENAKRINTAIYY